MRITVEMILKGHIDVFLHHLPMVRMLAFSHKGWSILPFSAGIDSRPASVLLLEQKQRELLNQMYELRELIEEQKNYREFLNELRELAKEQKKDRQLLNELRQLMTDVKRKLPDKKGK